MGKATLSVPVGNARGLASARRNLGVHVAPNTVQLLSNFEKSMCKLQLLACRVNRVRAVCITDDMYPDLLVIADIKE